MRQDHVSRFPGHVVATLYFEDNRGWSDLTDEII